MRLPRTLLNLCLIPLLMAGLFIPAPTFQASGAGSAGPFSPAARQALASLPPGERASFIITLRDQLAQAGAGSPLWAAAALPGKTARRSAVIQALQGFASRQQAGLLAQARAMQLQGQVGKLTPFWIFNGVSLEATPAAIRALARRPEVARVDLDPDPTLRIIPLGESAPGVKPALAAALPEPNVALVNAPALWSLGYTGQGVVVASLDTGVDAAHPDLAPGYRGGTNSWFDAYPSDQNPPTPTDRAGIYTGHGTMTMGLMVGGSAGGTAIGIAPGAQWISAKIFNNSGSATFTAIHLAFQWVLNPNNNPADPGSPDVVNNSWGYTPEHTCDNYFLPDLQALLAAGILPVFAAGNTGPGLNSDNSPGNLPEAFSVGAVDNNDNIASFSSRGPSACASTQAFPYLVAPGVALRSSYPSNQYSSCTGTSCAAPEVSGALALLLSAVPHLSVNLQQEALVQSAKHLTPAVPDNAAGYGRLDVLQAYNWLTTPLVVPNNLQAVPVSPLQVDLTWVDTNINETGYEAQRSPDGLTNWTSITTTGVNAVSYSDSSDLVEGTAYYYRVRAVNTSLGYNSNFETASATTPLQAPSGLIAAPVSNSQVNLYWTDHSTRATGYEVQHSLDGLTGWETLPAGLPGAATSYSDTTAVSGAVNYYRVRATGAVTGSESAFTDTAQAVAGTYWQYVAISIQ